MRAKLAILPLLALALLASACGKDEADEGASYPVTEAGALSLAEDGYAAFESLDAARVCPLVSDATIAAIEQTSGADGCEAAYGELFEARFFRKFAEGTATAKFGAVELGEGSASVAVTARANGRESSGTVEMVEQDGALVVDQFYVSEGAEALGDPPGG